MLGSISPRLNMGENGGGAREEHIQRRVEEEGGRSRLGYCVNGTVSVFRV